MTGKKRDIRYGHPVGLPALITIIIMVISHLVMTATDIDSLLRSYDQADKHHKTVLLNSIASELYNRHITSTQYKFDKSATPNQLDATMHYLWAEHLLNEGEPGYSLDEGIKARDLLEKSPSAFKGNVLRVVGKAQYKQDAFDEALKTFLTAYSNDLKLGNKEFISCDMSLIARVYLAVEEPALGITFIEKSIGMCRLLGHDDRLAHQLGLASQLYLLNNEPDKAMTAVNEACELSKNSGNDETAIRLVQKAAVLQALSRYDQAQRSILKALPTLLESHDNATLALAYNHLASISVKQGQYQQAINYHKTALEYSIKGNSPREERTAERGLWELMRQDNPTLAMLHLERYTALTDSTMKRLVPARAQVRAITAQHTELAELDKSSSRMSKLFKWASIALGLLLVLLLVTLFRVRRTASRALNLQRQTQAQRDLFFKNITQELHTPISVIMSAGQQLLESGRTSAEERQRIGTMIVNHSKNILRNMNSLIDIDKVDSSVERPEPKCGDIVMFVKMLVENFTEQAIQQSVSLVFSSPKSSLTVTFVPDYLRRIVHNLISNSIKFTPRNGKVTVELLPLDADKMRLIVSDTGKGIPVEERKRIFEPFFQSQSMDNGVETVLELSLVNHIVTSMGGTIAMESDLGHGTTFTIDFPVQPDSRHNEENDSTVPDFAEKRILHTNNDKHRQLIFIVEDHEDVAFFTANKLSGKYNLRFAHDGNEAFSNAQGLAPDLIITNTVLPLMSGKELIRKLRDNAFLNYIPIIALTPNNSESERLSCLKAGADAVLVKPFNSTELCLLVDHLINQQHKVREHYSKVSATDGNNSKKSQLNKDDSEFINHLVDIIHAQMGKQDIDMENIAAALGLSRKQLRNRVMTITGLTPVAFSLQVRLNFARHMIATQDSPLTTIAQHCCFHNFSHFSNAFKQEFGVSPLHYRKSLNDIKQPPSKS